MARLRYNGLTATLGGSLTSSATSVTFGAALSYNNGTAVPTVSSPDYIPLTILDSSGNLSEIVYLTAYTTAGTTGTITRGQEGTTGVSHSSGDKVVAGPTVQDIVPAVPTVIDSTGTYSATNPTLTVPATIAAGDLLLVPVGGNFDSTGVSGGNVDSAGWMRVASGVGSNHNCGLYAATATGTSAGSTVTVNVNNNGADSYLIAVRGWSYLAGMNGAQTAASPTVFPVALSDAARPGVLVLGFASVRVANMTLTSNLPTVVLRRTADSVSSGVWQGSPSQMLAFVTTTPTGGSFAACAVAISG